MPFITPRIFRLILNFMLDLCKKGDLEKVCKGYLTRILSSSNVERGSHMKWSYPNFFVFLSRELIYFTGY